MNKTEAKKRRLFDRYAANLTNYFIEFYPQIGDMTKRLYCCPLCFEAFEDLKKKDSGNFLTLEHNPPKTLGNNKATILTCHRCNSTYGAQLDQKARQLLSTEAFLYSTDERPIESKVIIDQYKIASLIRKSGKDIIIKPIEKSNPQAMRHLNNKIQKNVPINIKPNLQVPDWTEYSLVMLKIAYLKAFELFGYFFADLGNGANIRDVLTGKMAYPCINNGVIDIFSDEQRVGLQIVREPDDLRAIILTQKIKFNHLGNSVEKNVPVILPLPSEEGWELLKNYNNYRDKQVTLNLEKISTPSPPLEHPWQYYGLFYEQPD